MIYRVLLLFVLSTTCFAINRPAALQKGKLALMNGQMIDVYLAITENEQNNGLSGWKPEQLKKNEGMLFLYPQPGIRSFWMPNTHFDLDIIYFNSNLEVIKIDRNAPAHPNYKEPVPRLPALIAHHVLEIHARSKLSKQFAKGSQVKWMGKKSIREILRDTHQKR